METPVITTELMEFGNFSWPIACIMPLFMGIYFSAIYT